MMGGMLETRFCAKVGRGPLECSDAGPVGGLKGLVEESEGDGPEPDEGTARGPVGMLLGPVGGMVGETDGPGMWRAGIDGQPPRPPRGVKPPPRGAT